MTKSNAEKQRTFIASRKAQKRAQVRQQPAGQNRPPELIRFRVRLPAIVRSRLKAAGWLYDPVAAVWHLPEAPETWPDVQRLLDELDRYGIQHLSSQEYYPVPAGRAGKGV